MTNYLDMLPDVLIDRIYLWRDLQETDTEFNMVSVCFEKLMIEAVKTSEIIRILYDTTYIRDEQKLRLSRTFGSVTNYDRSNYMLLCESDNVLAIELFNARHKQIAIMSKLAEYDKYMEQLDEKNNSILESLYI